MKQFLAVAALVCGLVAIPAQAGTITFEGHGDDFLPTQTQDGFTFVFSAGGWGIITDGFSAGTYVQNGTTRLVAAGAPSQVTMSQTNGNPFSLSGFDAATLFPQFSGIMDITGNLSGGGSVLASVNITNVFGPFTLTGFENLASVVFAERNPAAFTQSGGISLDNLQVNTVPEPGFAGIVAGALAAAFFARRKMQATR